MDSRVDLSGPAQPPASGGAPQQIVVFFHGVGADGNDLIALAPFFAQALPDALFLAPDGPEPCDMAPFGRQWFSLLDRSTARLVQEVRRARSVIDGFLDGLLETHGLGDDKLALIGFSQGTMAALHVALRRPRPVAAMVGFSGALLESDEMAGEITARPPTLLVHGTHDEVVPAQALPLAEAGLQALGVEVQTMIRPGLGHGIDPEGAQLARQFLAQHLGVTPGT